MRRVSPALTITTGERPVTDSAAPASTPTPGGRAMRVAVVCERYDPTAGGNERSTAEIVRELAGRGHTVTVLTAGRPRPEARPDLEPHAEVVELPGGAKRAAGLVRFAAAARKTLDTGGFDASLSVTMSVPASLVQPRGGTVRETHARNVAMRPTAARQAVKRLGLALNPKQRVLLALERRTLRDPRVRRIVSISPYVTEQLERHYGTAGERVVLIPNAAAVPPMDAAERERLRSSVRASFAVPDGVPAFVFAAFNPRLKGWPTLTRAVARLRERGQPLVLFVAAPLTYGMIRDAAALGIRDAVRFVGPTRSMPALYAAADATVLPTWYDPASKVVIESLMLGVPAITTRSNGAAMWVASKGQDPRGVVLSNPGDPAALAAAMGQLCDDDTRAAMADAARRAGLAEELSMRRHVDRLEAALRDAGG